MGIGGGLESGIGTAGNIKGGGGEPSISNHHHSVTSPAINTSTLIFGMTHPFVTDPAHYIDKSMTPQMCEILLDEGPSQPGLNEEYDLQKNENGRRFLRQRYKPEIQKGMRSYLNWLVHSPINDRAYCFQSWQF
ncbi:hypothetical protein LOD99_10394 [Oopsacas minuta]|uniref:Uncharacterized protein n=1 Tax=Oopsacas minuta TaxID=111878 RepID=A0AAV7KGZ6_9METZ|nr:hypothetical protein LOD99_10394 [Oopsacas minuta]